MSGKEFRAKIGAWRNATNEKIDAVARQVCFEMSSRVVQATPVDTGFLRGSWQPSIGEPADAIAKPDQSGASALAAVSLTVVDVKAGDRFFMLNNAAYARFVEYGTSKMPPRLYVSDTVKQWPAVVSKITAELGLK